MVVQPGLCRTWVRNPEYRLSLDSAQLIFQLLNSESVAYHSSGVIIVWGPGYWGTGKTVINHSINQSITCMIFQLLNSESVADHSSGVILVETWVPVKQPSIK